VTLSAKGVTYWEGLDALCKASGKVMYDLGSSAKSAIRPGPYAPLPRKFSGPFAVLLETIDINSSGSFGHPDRYDEMQLHFRVAWENGTHPSFVRLFLLGLTDDIGTDLRPGEDEAATEAQTNVQEGRVSTGAAIVTPRLPDPKARKLARVRVEVELGFVLSYGGVSFKDPCATGATALECPQFAATLLTATRDQGRLTARLKVEPRAAAVQAITVESLVLRLRDGKTPAGQLMESSSDGMSITYGVSWDIGDKGEPAELSVRTPLEVHVERIPVEFTDVSLE
jgi:hypothetical protein